MLTGNNPTVLLSSTSLNVWERHCRTNLDV